MSARDDYPILGWMADQVKTRSEPLRAIEEIDRLRAENEALRKAVAQQQDRRRRLVNQLAHGRKNRKKLHDKIARYRNVVNAAVALRLHDRAPDRTVIPSDDWWTVRRRLLLALADATDDALAAGAGEGGNP